MMLLREPVCIVDGILDYIGESSDEYSRDFDRIARDRKGIIRTETEIYKNCIDVLLPYVSSLGFETKIIDVGCGDGHIINSMPFGERVGVDMSTTQLGQVDEGVIKIQADVEDVPIVSSYFDIAICTDVFEHVKNETLLVKELHRLLKPGGSLFFSTPWEQDLSVYDSPEYKASFRAYSCRHRRSVNSEMIEKSFYGFDLVSSTTITAIMKYMRLEPYATRFMHFVKKGWDDYKVPV